MINICCCLRLKVNKFQNCPRNVVSTVLLGYSGTLIPNMILSTTCGKYLLLWRKFLKFQLSEVTFSHTEGRRSEYKYRVNNNSRSRYYLVKTNSFVGTTFDKYISRYETWMCTKSVFMLQCIRDFRVYAYTRKSLIHCNIGIPEVSSPGSFVPGSFVPEKNPQISTKKYTKNP